MAMNILASSIVGQAIQTGGGLISTLANIGQAKRARKYERRMIAEQNFYNTPEQQMIRLRKAGLNPNLIYGNGAQTGNQTEISKYHQTDITNPLEGTAQTLPEMLMRSQNLETQNINNAYTRQLTANKVTENQINEEQKREARANANMAELTYNQTSRLAPYSVRKQIAESSYAEERVIQQKFLNSLNSNTRTRLQQEIKKNENLINQGKQNLTNLRQDELIKREELVFRKWQSELTKKGVTSSDNPIVRALVTMTAGSTTWLDNIKDILYEGFTPQFIQDAIEKK